MNCGCNDGLNVPTGLPGAPGAPGVFGGNSDSFLFNTALSGDPTLKNLLLNNANVSAVTAINVSEADAAGVIVNSWLAAIGISNSTTKAFIRISEITDSTKFAIYSVSAVSNQTTYYALTVAYLASSSNSPFALGDTLVFSYVITGNNGTAGTAVLFNDLSQLNSGNTSGITTVFESQNIPANTLINNGDSVSGQIAIQCLSTIFTTLPYIIINVGGNVFGFESFSQTNQVYVIDYTIDRISSSSYLLTKRTTDSVGNCRSYTQIFTGINFAAIQTVSVAANTNGNGGGIVCCKNYADYKQI